jgi:hypothetical protein
MNTITADRTRTQKFFIRSDSDFSRSVGGLPPGDPFPR